MSTREPLTEAKSMKARWPRGLPVHPRNNPLRELPDSHSAKLALIAHAECRRDCVGRKIEWPERGCEAFDQAWHSRLIGRRFSFSSYAYCFLSFDLILEEWITHPTAVTESEKRVVAAIRLQETLLDECERAARNEGNTRVLERVPQVRRFNELRLRAIRERWAADGLEIPQIPVDDKVLEVLGLHYPGT